MTTRGERDSAKAIRDEYADRFRYQAHRVTWKLAPNATRKGHAYFWVGTCADCDGSVSVGPSWSSSTGVVDLRHAGRCAAHPLPPVAVAIREFHAAGVIGRAVHGPSYNPLAPRACGDDCPCATPTQPSAT